jgi:hypothetical protein
MTQLAFFYYYISAYHIPALLARPAGGATTIANKILKKNCQNADHAGEKIDRGGLIRRLTFDHGGFDRNIIRSIATHPSSHINHDDDTPCPWYIHSAERRVASGGI